MIFGRSQPATHPAAPPLGVMDNTHISFFSLLVAQLLFVIVAVLYVLLNGLDVFQHRALNEQQRELQEQE